MHTVVFTCELGYPEVLRRLMFKTPTCTQDRLRRVEPTPGIGIPQEHATPWFGNSALSLPARVNMHLLGDRSYLLIVTLTRYLAVFVAA